MRHPRTNARPGPAPSFVPVGWLVVLRVQLWFAPQDGAGEMPPGSLGESSTRRRRGADFQDLLHRGVEHTVAVPVEGAVVVASSSLAAVLA